MLSSGNSKVIRKKKIQVDILGNLPREMVQNICLYLTPSDVFEVWNSNSRWRYQIMDDYFWKRKCQVDNVWPIEESKQTETFKKLTDRFGYWHSTYYYDYTLKYNWTNDIYEEIPVEACSSLQYNLLHYLDDEVAIITGYSPHKIYVINTSTGAVQNTFPINFDSLFKVRKVNDMLLFFAHCSLSLWNIHTSELLMTRRFEEKIKTGDISIHKNVIAFTRNTEFGKDFYILNVDTQDIKITYNIKQFCCYENLGILLTTNGTIKIWNIYNEKLINFSCPENHSIVRILLKDHYLIVFCEKYHMSTWTIDHIKQSLTKLISFTVIDCVVRAELYQNIYNFIVLDDNKIGYKIRDYTKFYIWDFLTGTYLFSIRACKTYLEEIVGNLLVFMLYSNTDYNSCEVWCPKTGKLIRKFMLRTNFMFKASKVLHFTETKMLCITNNVVSIQDFEKKIKIDA